MPHRLHLARRAVLWCGTAAPRYGLDDKGRRNAFSGGPLVSGAEALQWLKPPFFGVRLCGLMFAAARQPVPFTGSGLLSNSEEIRLRTELHPNEIFRR
jgi:hypothetical protein